MALAGDCWGDQKISEMLQNLGNTPWIKISWCHLYDSACVLPDQPVIGVHHYGHKPDRANRTVNLDMRYYPLDADLWAYYKSHISCTKRQNGLGAVLWAFSLSNIGCTTRQIVLVLFFKHFQEFLLAFQELIFEVGKDKNGIDAVLWAFSRSHIWCTKFL